MQVLVVDDDVATCEMVRDALDGEFSITCLNDSNRALERIRGGSFHVAILDVRMPGLSGIDLLAQIRRVDRDVAVVIITAHPTVETATASITHQVAAYVQKPIDLEKLRATLMRIASEKGILLESPERMLATVGRNVRSLRLKRRLSMRQMARRAGLSPSLVSSIERATASASLTSLLRVSAALGVRIADLFGES